MMSFGYFIWVFAWVRLAISFINWLFRQYLPQVDYLSETPLVSVLIPARNEEFNIQNILNDLLLFTYPKMEIIVYDDQSTDKTADIIEQFMQRSINLQLIKGTGPEKGWLGKNYACHQLALAAKGEKLLFLDADVRVNDGLLEKTIYYMYKHDLKLLSIFPKQIMASIGGRLSVPLMNWILLSLLPLPLVRFTNMGAFSAANGQFMFFDAQTYRDVLPHNICRTNQVEDIAILKEFKKRRLKRATLLGEDDIRCSMYDTLEEAINGFSKNVFHFFGGSRLLTIFFALVTTIGPFWIFIEDGCIWGIMYMFLIVLIRFFTSLSSRQSSLWNIMLQIPQQGVFLVIIIKALLSYQQKYIIWKGRNVYKY